MAAPDDVSVKASTIENAEVDALRQQLNNVILTQRAMAAKLDTLTTKLNADAGVTDTNYATNFVSGLTDSTGTNPASKVTRVYG